MAQLSLIKSAGGILIPSAPDTRDYLNRLKIGSVISADFKKARNPAFHRKYFSLLGLGFDYWEPVGGTISQPEREFVRGYVRFLAGQIGVEDALNTVADAYFDEVSQQRVVNISAAKSFDAFRRWVTVEAGHYDAFIMPDGSIHKEARSVSFAKMDDLEFNDLYKSTLDVLWNFILRRTFPTHQAAEDTAMQLLGYAA
ncbi:DUF1367 domain-containing protein [Prodigiosinella confusarubida]|uniref:DUF1367 domain-containing protein n=1 Tax=Serratia sp. (strain ATCC 39006) TaxID=104623 RepID=A0A2I5TKW0_SERS3|nr:DUF1367 family protein [Serratia sp. ATCC 39006]AUH00881.1 DUF1367 domain-containing protein [Serratia sp. ATCC 39006]AUH05203.1 DUF1367 domain-containing protein [Serratia sp. ATCC 39006]